MQAVPQLLAGSRGLLERVIQRLMYEMRIVAHASLVLHVLEGRLLRYACWTLTLKELNSFFHPFLYIFLFGKNKVFTCFKGTNIKVTIK